MLSTIGVGDYAPAYTNSWAKWSPHVVSAANGRTYHRLIFQSARAPDDGFEFRSGNFTVAGAKSQLCLTGIVVQGEVIAKTFPDVYMWAQTPDTLDVTPAWDTFPVAPPPSIPRMR